MIGWNGYFLNDIIWPKNQENWEKIGIKQMKKRRRQRGWWYFSCMVRNIYYFCVFYKREIWTVDDARLENFYVIWTVHLVNGKFSCTVKRIKDMMGFYSTDYMDLSEFFLHILKTKFYILHKKINFMYFLWVNLLILAGIFVHIGVLIMRNKTNQKIPSIIKKSLNSLTH